MKRKKRHSNARLFAAAILGAALLGLQCVDNAKQSDNDLAMLAAAGHGYDAASTIPEARMIESLIYGNGGDGNELRAPLARRLPSLSERPTLTVKPVIKPRPIPRPIGPIGIINPFNRDSDKDGMTDWAENHLMRKFAPYLRLHPNEKSLPSDVHLVLSRAKLSHRSNNACRNRVVWNYGQLSSRRISNTTVPGLGSSGWRFCGNTSNRYHTWKDYTERKSFYMEIPHDLYPGNLAKAKCYAHVRPGNVGGSKYLIDYWFFYAYNPAYKGLAGGHEGDWEHIQVRVGADEKMKSVRFFAHGGEHKDRVPGGGHFWLTNAGRPMVYSARWTHASYPESGTHWRKGAAIATPDYTANGGKVLDCSQTGRLVNIGRTKYPAWNQEWIKYRGTWGYKRTFGRAGAPTGPRMD